MKKGWKGERQRHSCASKGVKTVETKKTGLTLSERKKYSDIANRTINFNLDFWSLKEIAEFEKEFGKIQSVTEQSGFGVDYFDIETDSGEFMVFKTYKDAEYYAKAYVLEDLENNPEIFNQDWLQQHLDWDNVESTMEDIYNEWNCGYVNDIEDESDDTFKNRLISELVHWNVIDEKQAKNKKYIKDNIENLKEKFVEKLTESQIDEGRSGLDHFESNFGKDEYGNLIKNQNWIDYEAASEDAIDTDGIAHFLNHYDGVEHNIGKAYIYQTN